MEEKILVETAAKVAAKPNMVKKVVTFVTKTKVGKIAGIGSLITVVAVVGYGVGKVVEKKVVPACQKFGNNVKTWNENQKAKRAAKKNGTVEETAEIVEEETE